MSWWTEVLLTASVSEDVSPEDAPATFPAIAQINSWLRENGCRDLFVIAHPEGEGHAPQSCFAGNFKGLNRKGFIQAVKSAHWRWSEQVQLFLRQEDDRGFVEIRLWDDVITQPSP